MQISCAPGHCCLSTLEKFPKDEPRGMYALRVYQCIIIMYQSCGGGRHSILMINSFSKIYHSLKGA